MNNDELKKKIVDIIAPWVSAYGDDEAIADALIAAGLRFGETYSHTATFNMAQLDRINELERQLGEMKNLAEVAERDAASWKD